MQLKRENNYNKTISYSTRDQLDEIREIKVVNNKKISWNTFNEKDCFKEQKVHASPQKAEDRKFNSIIEKSCN